jgi:Domain of unknown function (DUF6046)
LRKYTPPTEEGEAAEIKYAIPAVAPIDEGTFKSNLNTPVQFPMWFQAGVYNIMTGGEIAGVSFSEMYLPWTSVVSFSRSKRITKTYMSSQKSVVVEQYGFEPWDIKIKGFIIKGNNKERTSVAEQVKDMQRFEEISDSIKVGGSVFEWLKISEVSIEKISYPDARDLNMEIIKPFEISMISIEPDELVFI